MPAAPTRTDQSAATIRPGTTTRGSRSATTKCGALRETIVASRRHPRHQSTRTPRRPRLRASRRHQGQSTLAQGGPMPWRTYTRAWGASRSVRRSENRRSRHLVSCPDPGSRRKAKRPTTNGSGRRVLTRRPRRTGRVRGGVGARFQVGRIRPGSAERCRRPGLTDSSARSRRQSKFRCRFPSLRPQAPSSVGSLAGFPDC